MLSQDTRNLARALAALGEVPGEIVPVKSEDLVRIAMGIDDIADGIAVLEAGIIPAHLRGNVYPRSELVGDNVVPFSRPWGGHPPGSDSGFGPEGGAA